MFLSTGQTVLRPGLVIGNGGLFARQRTTLLRTPNMSVLGRGDDPVALIGIRHFLDRAGAILETGRRGTFQVFWQPAVREYIRAIKRSAGQRIRFIPFSVRLAAVLLYGTRLLRIPVPMEPGQIPALAMNRTAPWKSDLPLLLPGRKTEFSLEWALRELASAS